MTHPYPLVPLASIAKPDKPIVQTVSGQLEVETLAPKFPLSWSHYVKLLSVENPNARAFYAAEHLTLPDETPPVGLILCSKPNAAVAHYALNDMHNAILTAQYRLALPDEHLLAAEVERVRHALEAHRPAAPE